MSASPGRRGGLILALIVMPLITPALIFGAGAVMDALDGTSRGAFMFLAAFSVAAVGLSGWGAALPTRDLARLTVGLALVGFGLSAVSGAWMFASQANALLGNRIFTVKILLLTALACNAAWFHGRGSLDKFDGLAKAQLWASHGMWLAVMGCGRLLAISH